VPGAENGQGCGVGAGEKVQGVGGGGPVRVGSADLQDGRDPADDLVEQQQGGVAPRQPLRGVSGQKVPIFTPAWVAEADGLRLN
jgi:hypothetical protein